MHIDRYTANMTNFDEKDSGMLKTETSAKVSEPRNFANTYNKFLKGRKKLKTREQKCRNNIILERNLK